jgi:hypothetical protein
MPFSYFFLHTMLAVLIAQAVDIPKNKSACSEYNGNA